MMPLGVFAPEEPDAKTKTAVPLFYQEGEWFIAKAKHAKFLVTTTSEVKTGWQKVMDLWEDYQAWGEGHIEWDNDDYPVELFPQLWKQFQYEVEYLWSGEYEDKATIRRYNVPNCVPIQGGRIHPDGVEPVLDPNGMRRIY